MTPAEAAWVAGIIEGEGCIIWTEGRPRFQVAMTDLDVLERLAAWTEAGTLRSTKKQKAHYKQKWVWTVTRQDDFVRISAEILPWLLGQRGAKLREVLSLHEENQARIAAKFKAGKGLCPHGHDREVVGVYDKNQCAECGRQKSAKQRAKQKENASVD